MNETNDKINIKRSNNENTQDEITHESGEQSADSGSGNQIKPSKRRIIVPIRRTRLNPTQNQQKQQRQQPASTTTTTTTVSTPSDVDSSNESTNRKSLSIEQKKKLFIKRRRITPKPLIALEPSINEASLSSSVPFSRESVVAKLATPILSVELKPRLTTVQRTYTYVVTRVHDKQSETISSTLVRDQIKTLTDTITHTILNIQPTETQKIAHTSIV